MKKKTVYTKEGLASRRRALQEQKPWLLTPSGKKTGQRITLTCKCGKNFDVVPSQVTRRKYCSKSCLATFTPRQPLSDQQKKAISEAQKKRYAADPASNPFYGRTPSNYRGWGHGGYCAELGFHVRSTWERDYLLALQYAKIEFEYEPERYDLGQGRGTYLPDIRLGGQDIFIEITGWDKPGKEEKRALFQEVYGWPLYVVKDRPTKENLEKFVSMCKGVMNPNDSRTDPQP